MNKTIVLVFICSFFMSSTIVSMHYASEELDEECCVNPDAIFGNELIFKFSSEESEEDEINDESEECSYSQDSTQYSTQVAACIGLLYLQSPLAAFSTSSSEETEDITCPYCNASLFSISVEFIAEDKEYVCTDCAKTLVAWKALQSEKDSLLDVSSASSEIEMLINKAFEDDEQLFNDDEPLFDHKKGNAHSHAIKRHYRHKRSSIRALEKEMYSEPMNKQKLRSLRAQQDLALAGKVKLPNL